MPTIFSTHWSTRSNGFLLFWRTVGSYEDKARGGAKTILKRMAINRRRAGAVDTACLASNLLMDQVGRSTQGLITMSHKASLQNLPFASVKASTDGSAAISAPATHDALKSVRLTLNGRSVELLLEARATLLDALREYAGLTGTKKGCDRGQCGACTVIANGRRINACLTLAIMHAGDTITTIEGLASDGTPSPLQQAFIEMDAFQCGFCTPGQLCSATALLQEFQAGEASAATKDVRQPPSRLSSGEIRERMSGNICRCGAYPNIVSAIESVVGQKS